MELKTDGAKGGKWLALLAAFLGWMFDGFEMGLFPLVARPALKELLGQGLTPEELKQVIGTWFGAIMAGFLLGAAAGGVIFGWLGDRVGRVRAMVWSVLTYSVFSGLCCLAQAPWHLAALRFIASMGMGGEWALGVALVMEIWPAKHRPILAGLIGAAANVGFLLIAAIGLVLTQIIAGTTSFLQSFLPEDVAVALTRNSAWRLLLLIGAVPALLTFFIRLFVPESHRWQEAAAKSPKNRVADVFKGGLARPTILAMMLGATALLGTWGSVQWIPSWADKMTGGDLPAAKSWAQVWSGFGAICGCILAAMMAEWFTRRRAFFVLSLASLLACAYLFRAEQHFGNWFLFQVFVVGGVTASFYGWLPLYLPELFPTRIRATAQGLAFNFGRILAAAGTLGAGQLLNLFQEDYARMCSVISLIYVVGLVLIWFCPETKGKPLPE
jgi:MFS family permease